MSDNWILLISEDPLYIPNTDQQWRSRDRFRELAPEAEETQIKVGDSVQFYDSGANFERIICPSCRSEIATDWWQCRMDDDFEDGGFKLSEYLTPCCNAAHTLHALIYDWPQGFGKFAIHAKNPKIGKLQDSHIAEFEQLLGTPLRVVYRHI